MIWKICHSQLPVDFLKIDGNFVRNVDNLKYYGQFTN